MAGLDRSRSGTKLADDWWINRLTGWLIDWLIHLFIDRIALPLNSGTAPAAEDYKMLALCNKENYGIEEI